MHSIIGVGHSGIGKETGDGVVPVTSAKHPGVDSELMVKAKHDLHHHPGHDQRSCTYPEGLHASNDDGYSTPVALMPASSRPTEPSQLR